MNELSKFSADAEVAIFESAGGKNQILDGLIDRKSWGGGGSGVAIDKPSVYFIQKQRKNFV